MVIVKKVPYIFTNFLKVLVELWESFFLRGRGEEKFLNNNISVRDKKATLAVGTRIKEEGFEGDVNLGKIDAKC